MIVQYEKMLHFIAQFPAPVVVSSELVAKMNLVCDSKENDVLRKTYPHAK